MTTQLVVCIGNRLVGDDAAGPTVYDALKHRQLPEGTSLKLLETRGIALLDDFAGQDRLIVVDAVQLQAMPGTIHRLDRAALRNAARMPVTSHDIALTETLSVAALLYPERLPKEVVFIGIQGKDFNVLGAPLSEAVSRAVPEVVAHIVAMLQEGDLSMEASSPSKN